MPIYEYKCAECGHDLEAIRKFSDPPLVECPACGKSALERQMSQSSFALKGGGWYADGYGPGGAKSESKSSSSSTASSSAPAAPSTASDKGDGGSTKSEAKPSSEKTA